MEEQTTLSSGLRINLLATCLCAFLTALVVYLWTGSLGWGFATYCASGSFFLILFMVLSGMDKAKRSAKQNSFTSKE